MSSLRGLQAATPPKGLKHPQELLVIKSPLHAHLRAWQAGLAAHPDREFAAYILEGLQYGFRVGFDHTKPLKPASKNMPSAQLHPEVIDQYLAKEASAGRILGPIAAGTTNRAQTNRLGVVPKGHTPGRWRLITDLSFPEGASVNEGIDPHLCSIQYTSVDRVAKAAQSLGVGTLLAKLDVQAAYRLIPVHPDDRRLMGFCWQGAHYVDGMLPFGLRSAPIIFTAVADALEWILRQRGVSEVDHYLDDFITMGPPASQTCRRNLDIILHACEDLGVPLAMEKLEGPSTCLIFLGIEIDTTTGTLHLPESKFTRLRQVLESWSGRKACTRRELESLVGLLHHASCVIHPGRSFLRRMIDLLRLPRRHHHQLRLNKQFRADLRWWLTFASHWNGRALFPLTRPARFEVTSDASGHWGCGAWFQSSWFQFKWPEESLHHHITFKELMAVLLACAVWGSAWHGSRVSCRCDNQAAVQTIASRSCRDPSLMHLLRCLFFLEAHYQFELVATHLPGVENSLADDLSRNRLPSFRSKAPSADILPTPLPLQLPSLLLDLSHDWTSPVWTQQFSDIVRKV